MKLSDFKDILLIADPQITKYHGTGKGNYTVWTPGGITRTLSDDIDSDLVQRVYVERFTKLDKEPILSAIWKALSDNFIPFEHEQDIETESKYIHHTFTCYVPVDEI